MSFRTQSDVSATQDYGTGVPYPVGTQFTLNAFGKQEYQKESAKPWSNIYLPKHTFWLRKRGSFSDNVQTFGYNYQDPRGGFGGMSIYGEHGLNTLLPWFDVRRPGEPNYEPPMRGGSVVEL